MRKLHKFIVSLTIFCMIASGGCIKFGDPPVGEGPEPINRFAPCTDTLVDNEVFLFLTSGNPVGGISLESPNPTADGLDYFGSTYGDFEIILSGSVAESRTFNIG
jgi:hypothetical protein